MYMCAIISENLVIEDTANQPYFSLGDHIPHIQWFN